MANSVIINWEEKVLYYPRGWSYRQIYYSYRDCLDADMSLSEIGGPYVERSEQVGYVPKPRKFGIFAFNYEKFEVFGSVMIYSPNPDWGFVERKN